MPARRASAPSAAARPSSDSSGGKIPRATSRRSSSAMVVRSLRRSRDPRTPSGSAMTRVASSRISSRIVAISAPTPSRSSCSSRRRCASRTVTRRSRERRSSSVCAESSSARRARSTERRAFSRPMPACAARSSSSVRSVGRRGSPGDFATARSPIVSPACSIGSVRSGSPTVGLRRPGRGPDPVGALGTRKEHPDAGGACTHTACRRLRHVREELVDRWDLRDPVAELGHHLVRRRPPAVDEPVREPVEQGPGRLHGDGNQDRRAEPERLVGLVADQCPESDHDRAVDDHDPERQAHVRDRLRDDDVDVVEAVLEDRQRRRCRDAQHEHHQERDPEDSRNPLRC